jgi:predicted extracellular nuclease/sugar lactone lactonase YvrE
MFISCVVSLRHCMSRFKPYFNSLTATIVLLTILFTGFVQAQTITTIAGNGSIGFSGDGGDATAASISMYSGDMDIDAAGNIYLADQPNYRIRKIATNGIITTIAGTGSSGFSGDGGQASLASLYYPGGVAIGPDGSIYVSDTLNYRIRKITPDGIINTIAGTGENATSGDGGLALSANITVPREIRFYAGSLYFISYDRIRKIDANGIITTVAGGGNNSGVLATNAFLSGPRGFNFDAVGNMYIAVTGDHLVRKVDTAGIISTISGNGGGSWPSANNIPALGAPLQSPTGIAFDAAGNLYVSEAGGARIRKISTDGILTTFAGTGTSGFSGDGGSATSANLGSPTAMAMTASGTLYFTDSGTRIRRVGLSAPGAPTISTAVPFSGSVRVNFQPPANDGGQAVLGYTVTSLPAGGVDTQADGLSTSHLMTGLTNGTPYTFTVKARNATGSGAASAASASVIPSPLPSEPLNVVATPGNKLATVSFQAPITDGGSSIAGYTAVSIPAGGVDQNAGQPSLTHLISGLTNGTSYQFTVVASNAAGNGPVSAISNSVTPANVPGAPTISSLTAGNSQVTVGLTAPVDTGGIPIIGYFVTSIPSGGIDANNGSPGLSHVITGLSNGTSYSFRATATNAIGISPASSISASAIPATVPGAPLMGSASPGNQLATVSFSVPTENGGSAITGYTVTSLPAGGVDSNAGSSSTSHTITGLTNGTSYTFTVRAINSAGLSATSAASNSVVPNTVTVPGLPIIQSATAGNAQATVNFLSPTNNGGSAITGYTVSSIPAGGVDTNAGSTGLSHLITGLSNGTAYTFVVRATNAIGVSAPSAASVSIIPATLPGAPNIGAVNISANAGAIQATVNFSPPSNNGGNTITGYVVTSLPAGAIDSMANSPQSAHVMTGLAAATTYTFSVRATNAQGTGPASGNSSGISLSVPGAPTSVTGTAGFSQATISFVAPVNTGGTPITGYTVTSSPAGGVDSTADGLGLTRVITGLNNNTNYTFTARAINAVGTGPASAASASVKPLSSIAAALSISDVRVVEGNTGIQSAVFTVRLSKASASTVTFDIFTANTGTATAGIDYSTVNQVGFSMAPGVTTAMFVVPVFGDLMLESDETIKVIISSPTGAAIADAEGLAIIVNDDRSNAVVSTFAGNGTQGFSGDGGAAINAALFFANGLAIANDGSVFISDSANHRIRRVNPDGVISTYAGNGTGTFSGDGGQALSASLKAPAGLAFDKLGNLYVADAGNQRIRKITPTGTISTIVGNGNQGYSGDGDMALLASLYSPRDVAFDEADNLYISDSGNCRVRKVSNTTGIISTIFDPNLPVGASVGCANASEVELRATGGIAVDKLGNVYVADSGGYRVRMVTPQGVTSTIAGDINQRGNTGDGGLANAATLLGPSDIAIASDGSLYILDSDRVRKITPNGYIEPFAGNGVAGYSGDGGAAMDASFNTLLAAALDKDGSLYLADVNNQRVRKLTALIPDAPSQVTAVAGNAQATVNFTASSVTGGSAITQYRVVTRPAAGVDTNAGSAGLSHVVTGLTNGVAYTFSIVAVTANGESPESVASNRVTPFDTNLPALSIAEIRVPEGNSGTKTAVLTVNMSRVATSIVTFNVASSNGTATAGSDYVAVNLSNVSIPVGASSVTFPMTINGDVNLEAHETVKITLSAAAGAWLSNDQATVTILNDEATSPIITTVVGNGSEGSSGDGGAAIAARLNSPWAVALAADGSLYISDSLNHRIRRRMTDGRIITIAGNGVRSFSGDGGKAVDASIDYPSGLVFDRTGNLYFTDGGNARIRRINTDGIITTVAGNGTHGLSGDGGPAINAQLNIPSDIAIDSSGNLFIADQGNNRVRKVDVTGIISTVVGSPFMGSNGGGFSGDGGPAIDAYLNFPTAVAIDPQDRLYISDRINNRVRRVDTNGVIQTFAGNGSLGNIGDGGSAVNANLGSPNGLAFDRQGNLYIASATIRMVTPSGTISTIAGLYGSTISFGGDGGPATSAQLNQPADVAVDPIGNYYIADRLNNRIRYVDIGVPHAPTNVIAVPGNGQAVVSFQIPVVEAASAATSYEVVSIPSGGVDQQSGTLATSHTMVGLVNGVGYTFIVHAINPNGPGVFSDPSNEVVPTASLIPELSIADASISEGNSGARPLAFNVSLSAPAPLQGVSFDIVAASVNGTGNSALAGNDYSSPSTTTVTIPSGQSSTSYWVKILGDTRVENDEIFQVTLSQVTGASLGRSRAVGRILNDDTAQLTSSPDDAAQHPDGSAGSDGPVQSGANAPSASKTGFISIADIQGRGLISPMLGQSVETRGVVTALGKFGFYIQTPDSERDGDPATSDGIFVTQTGSAQIKIGQRLQISGIVLEVINGADEEQLTQTQIAARKIAVLGNETRLPAPVTLKAVDASPKQAIGWRERYEGMRVLAPQLKVVGPTNGNKEVVGMHLQTGGVFHAVLGNVARPFLEPGLNPLAAPSDARPGVRLVIADGNPEILRVDSTGQMGAMGWTVDVGDKLTNIVGVLGYTDAAYTLLPDAGQNVQISLAANPRAVARAKASETTVGYMNMRRLFDDRRSATGKEPVLTNAAYQLRLAKTANAICSYMHSPDILMADDIEGSSVLADLADAASSGAGNVLFPSQCPVMPSYKSIGTSRSDKDGLASGILVNQSEVRPGIPKVQIVSASPINATERFVNAGINEPLFDRTLLVLHVLINQQNGSQRPLTIIAGGLSPLESVSRKAAGTVAVHSYLSNKRRLQALSIARSVQSIKSARPLEQVLLLGEFDTPEFNDGRDDLLGIITGKQTRGTVRNFVASPVLEPLVNLNSETQNAERYTVVRNGSATTTDHIIGNRALLSAGSEFRIEYARINADFAEDNHDDYTVPMRVSDHDPAVLFIGDTSDKLQSNGKKE